MQTFDTMPAYEDAKWDGENLLNREEAVKWSGKFPPPAVGAKVVATINGLGAATVVGYFVESGWLGLLVKFADPPAWYVKQNASSNAVGHLFGAEIKLPN